MTNIPASQDVYISLGTGNELVYNQTDTLFCGINVTEVNNTSVRSYPGVPVIQFDISGVNITDDDVAILVLKAESIRMPDNSALVALLTIGSDWNEESDLTTFLVNILPAWSIIKKNDLTQLSSNTDGDKIFAFDVSKKLMEAYAKGDKISFLLEVISNSSSEIDFFSRESGQGPYLMIMPYPTTPESDQICSAQFCFTERSNLWSGNKCEPDRRDGSCRGRTAEQPVERCEDRPETGPGLKKKSDSINIVTLFKFFA